MAEPDADWEAFMTWLEADAAHAERYDRAGSALRDAEEAVSALPRTQTSVEKHVAPPTTPERPRARPARWVGGAVAAAVAVAAGLGVWTQGPQPYVVASAAGAQRTIMLEDGSSIVLAGGSSVRLDHRDPRVATVERGEALFRVHHDADRPFAVGAGNLRLVDLGTVFDVKLAGPRTRVSVAEGAVMADPDGAALRLNPGQAVIAEGGQLERRVVDASDVGGWQNDRLVFDDAPLSEVAADLTRLLAQSVSATPAVAARRFNGTLDLRTLKDRPVLLGKVLGVRVREDAAGWTLEPPR
jgi:transmembrane sensor